MKARDADVPASLRGIIFQLLENLGSMSRGPLEDQLKALTDGERKVLARLGVRFGVEHVFFPAALKATPLRLRGLLWIAAHRDDESLSAPPSLPPAGRVSVPVVAGVPDGFYAACGYRVIGAAGYRVDMLERFAAEARRLAREKVKLLPPATLSYLGITPEVGVVVLKSLGFRAKIEETGLHFVPRRRRHQPAPDPRKPAPAESRADSPFAKLRELMPS